MHRLDDALLQIDNIENECVKVLNQVVAFCVADGNGHRPDVFRLMAVPMVYSAWERAFRISTAVAIRHLVESTLTIAKLSADQKAMLLQREPFFKSFSDKMPSTKGARGPRKGEFEILSDLLKRFELWSLSKASLGANAEDYVMTFSNVDHIVLRLHEKILAAGPTIDKDTGLPIDLSPLGELLNRRNEISHGGSIQPPGEKNLDELFKFTKSLLTSYCESMRRVIRKNTSFLPPHQRVRGYQRRQQHNKHIIKATITRNKLLP
jgi:RiboL-PSP-HEPN